MFKIGSKNSAATPQTSRAALQYERIGNRPLLDLDTLQHDDRTPRKSLGKRLGEACVSALATQARWLGCGPTRHDLYRMHLESDLEKHGIGRYASKTSQTPPPAAKTGRMLDLPRGKLGKRESFVQGRVFQQGADGNISIVALGDRRFAAAKTFRGNQHESYDKAVKEAGLLGRFGDSSARVLVGSDGTPHMLMRLATASLHDLNRAVSTPSENQARGALARKTLRDLAPQLANMHACGYTHRDIKPGNILCYEDGTLRMSDFGRSRSVGETGRSGTTGTLAYAPLEVLYCDDSITPKSDVWSLGMTLLNSLVSLKQAPSQALPTRANAAMMILVVEELLELRNQILRNGRIDIPALQASQSLWADYFRKTAAVDMQLTQYILNTMVAPLEERRPADALAFGPTSGGRCRARFCEGAGYLPKSLSVRHIEKGELRSAGLRLRYLCPQARLMPTRQRFQRAETR